MPVSGYWSLVSELRSFLSFQHQASSNCHQRWFKDGMQEDELAFQVSGFSGSGPTRRTEFIDSLLTPETRNLKSVNGYEGDYLVS